jgi:Putative Actinobacterial Holin-X, holin superfamily III
MTDRDEAPRRSAFRLARDLVSGFVQLAKLEVQHGRQEIAAMLAEVGRGAALAGAAFGLVIMGLVTLDVALLLGVAALFEVLPDWLVAVIVVAMSGLVILLTGLLGAGRVYREQPWIAIPLLILVAIFAVPAYFGFMPPWFTALFVFVIELGIAAVLGLRARSHIHVGPPQETIASVKEEVAWAKRLIRRD